MSEGSRLRRLLGPSSDALVSIYWRAISWWEDSGFWWRRLIVPMFIHPVFRDNTGNLAEDELAVVCMVRNGEPWIDEFVKHYRGLGVRRLVFLDNGSSDRTIEILRDHGEGITVFRSNLSFSAFRRALKSWMVDRYAGKGWVLVADVDELFDFPMRGRADLGCLIRYLNERGYSAVVLQMLDLFSTESPFGDGSTDGPGDSIWYDVLGIRDYSVDEKTYPAVRRTLRVTNEAIRVHYGGIQEQAFGANPLLTKTVLFRPAAGARFSQEHWVTYATLADFSAVLLHYKFVGDFVGRMRDAVRRGNYWRRSLHQKKMLEAMERDPSLRLKRETSRRFESIDELAECGFLVVSDDYQRAMNLPVFQGERGSRGEGNR